MSQSDLFRHGEISAKSQKAGVGFLVSFFRSEEGPHNVNEAEVCAPVEVQSECDDEDFANSLLMDLSSPRKTGDVSSYFPADDIVCSVTADSPVDTKHTLAVSHAEEVRAEKTSSRGSVWGSASFFERPQTPPAARDAPRVSSGRAAGTVLQTRRTRILTGTPGDASSDGSSPAWRGKQFHVAFQGSKEVTVVEDETASTRSETQDGCQQREGGTWEQAKENSISSSESVARPLTHSAGPYLRRKGDLQRTVKSGVFLTGALTVPVALVAIACISPWSFGSGLSLLVGGAIVFLCGYFGTTLSSRPLLIAYLALLCGLLASLLVATVFNTHLAVQAFRAVRHVYFDPSEATTTRRLETAVVSSHSSTSKVTLPLALEIPGRTNMQGMLTNLRKPSFQNLPVPSATAAYREQRFIEAAEVQQSSKNAKHPRIYDMRHASGDSFDVTRAVGTRFPRAPVAERRLSPLQDSQKNNATPVQTTTEPVIRVEAERCNAVPLSLTKYIGPTKVQLETYGLLCGFSLYNIWGVVDAWDVDCETFCGFKYLATKRYMWNVGKETLRQGESEAVTAGMGPGSAGRAFAFREQKKEATGRTKEHTWSVNRLQEETGKRETHESQPADVARVTSREDALATWRENTPVADQIKCMELALNLSCGVVRSFYLVLLPGLSVVMVVTSLALFTAGTSLVKKGIQLSQEFAR
uniref:Inner membrane complex protein IMC3 n=1 Tax=Toxoplasma gondii COUG TaxID=1074873 RepID=A0A2G8Y685_TOXGO|nr:inner membrane complex protein IMC3 [Toxoplasma gondii COUG]